MLDVAAKDWHMFLSVANIAVVGAGAGTPYKDMGELLAAMKAKPGEVKVATAGVTSGGHNAMEAISRATGVKYRHVTYDGGNPAVVATVSGETDITTQLAVEQAEMIRGKRIRPLRPSATPMEIEATAPSSDQQDHPRLQGPANIRDLHTKGVPPEGCDVRHWEKGMATTPPEGYAVNKAASSPGGGRRAQRRPCGVRPAGCCTPPARPSGTERSESQDRKAFT